MLENQVSVLEFAGMFDESGNHLERPVSARGWMVPAQIELATGVLPDWVDDRVRTVVEQGSGRLLPALVFREASGEPMISGFDSDDSPDAEGEEPRWTSGDDRAVLERFHKLDGPEAALSFARKFGTLNLCFHGWPVPWSPPRLGKIPPAVHGRECGIARFEPISRWLFFARLVETLLYLTADLRLGNSGKPEHWEQVETSLNFVNHPGAQPLHMVSLSSQRSYLADLLSNLHAEFARPTFELHWSGEEPALMIGSPAGVLGAVFRQLLMATAGGGAVACSGCGKFYARKRKPSKSRRNYCQECRNQRIPQRDAQRAYRKRNEQTE